MVEKKKKSNKNILIAIAAVAIIMIGGAAAFMSAGQQASQTQQDLLTRLETPTIPAAYALGSEDAPVTIVEFGDYLCTYCHRFHEETRDAVIANLVNTGKARLIFKDFTINDHLDGGSTMAAKASYCAADQGRYWQFHEEVYNKWGGERSGWITESSMADYAKNAGVQDSEQFKSCLASDKYSAVVKENYNLAVSAGLRGTPGFIIIPEQGNPIKIPGAFPYSAFEQAVDSFA